MTTALVGGTLIDGNGGPPAPNITVLIEGGRIADLGPADEISVPAHATSVDASGKTIMPGLIEGHIHLNSELAVYKDGPPEGLLESAAIRAVAAVAKILDAGFTTVRAMGTLPAVRDYTNVAVRRAIDEGI